MKSALALMLSLAFISTASGKVVTQTIEYRSGDRTCEGYLAYDDSTAGQRPGVLVVHQWMGLTDYEKSRCEQLAQLGYVAFAADLYGQGVRPDSPQSAGAQAGQFKGDPSLTRRHVGAAFDWLTQHERVDPAKTAAIGYCFGGWVCLELARSGKDVAGVVGFHTGLDASNPDDAQNIKGRVLILNGADDPHVSPESVAAFMKEMTDAGVKYEYVAYEDAVHAFTQPMAGDDKAKGAAYNEAADKRSWDAMKRFFVDLFK